MIIYNKIIPPKGYLAITIYPFIFVRWNHKLTDVDYNHELIHMQQEKELLIVFFYIIYIFEFLVNLFKYRNLKIAYRKISFEKEAYQNEKNLDYIKTRKHFNQWRK